MRTAQEIKELKEHYQQLINDQKGHIDHHEVVLDVLENDLYDEDIEAKYFNENDPWPEQIGFKTRQWLDGEIEKEDIF